MKVVVVYSGVGRGRKRDDGDMLIRMEQPARTKTLVQPYEKVLDLAAS